MEESMFTPDHRRAAAVVMADFGLKTFGMDLAKNSQGQTPVVIALPNDRIDQVFNLVKRLGGVANIVVVSAKEIQVLPIWETTEIPSARSKVFSTTLSIGRFLQEISAEPTGSPLHIAFMERDFDSEFLTEAVLELTPN